jgi:hypothetical protein
LLSNYNIKYICTIYTRLNTCLTSIPRFASRVKLTLRLLKILFQGVDVVEWSRALDVRLIEWYCSASMVWVQIPSKEEQILIALKSNSNTVWFNLQTYMIFSFNLVSFVTLRSSATYILYGCHLLLDVCIIYFISSDCIMNSSLSYTIYQKLLS